MQGEGEEARDCFQLSGLESNGAEQIPMLPTGRLDQKKKSATKVIFEGICDVFLLRVPKFIRNYKL